MIIHVLTLFPDFFKGFLESSILARAIRRGIVDIRVVNIRDFALDKHRSCDDYTYGGGPGMVLKPEPVARALESVIKGNERIVCTTPSGRLFSQRMAEEFSGENSLVILCGRYEGIDQRIIDMYVTDEVSIGDYILSGGEIAAEVIIDATVRLVKGVINDVSLKEESLENGLLEYPQYTRPEVFRERKVPPVLLSGNHEEIRKWRLHKSIEKTLMVRPEIIEKFEKEGKLPDEISKIVREIKSKGESNEINKGN